MAIEVKVADQGDLTSGFIQGLPYMGNRRRRFGRIDGNSHQFRAGAGQLKDLPGRGSHISGVRVGHGLYNHGCSTTDSDVAYADWNGGVA